MAERQTERGKEVFVHGGFEYVHKRVTMGGNIRTWRCRLFNKAGCRCPAVIRTTGANNVVVGAPTQHSHQSDLVGDLARQATNDARRQAVEQPSQSTRSVVSSAVEELGDLVQARLPA